MQSAALASAQRKDYCIDQCKDQSKDPSRDQEKQDRKPMKICDTHAHYDDEAFDEDRELLLGEKLEEAGVEFVVNMGASMRGADASLALAGQYGVVYAGCGIHPDDVGVFERAGRSNDAECAEKSSDADGAGRSSDAERAENSGGASAEEEQDTHHFTSADDVLQHLRDLCRKDRTVCVGEIGLDYHWMVEEKEVQKRWFREQIALASEMDLPINVHSRDASQDTFDMIHAAYQEGKFTGGIIHCYSGSLELAREYVRMGYHIGIGGVVTFKNSKVLKKVVTEIPLEYLVTETDCPYLSPEPYRGKRNDSRNIRYVIEKIAELKEMDVEACAEILRRNAYEVYPKIHG